MKTLWHRAVMKLFVWSGHQLFDSVAVYTPWDEDEEADTMAIHFASDDRTLYDSCKNFIEEN